MLPAPSTLPSNLYRPECTCDSLTAVRTIFRDVLRVEFAFVFWEPLSALLMGTLSATPFGILILFSSIRHEPDWRPLPPIEPGIQDSFLAIL